MHESITAEEWYILRDDRTSKTEQVSVDLFKNFKVGVIVNQHVKTSYALQVTLLLTLNMLSRWCRNIVIEMPNVDVIPPIFSSNTFPEHLISLMTNNDPFGNFKILEVQGNSVDAVIHVGPKSDKIIMNSFWVFGFEWFAGCGFGEPPVHDNAYKEGNIVGASFAANLGVAELMKYCLSRKTPSTISKWYSLFDSTEVKNIKDTPVYPDYNPVNNFGNIHMVGCGAVGSSLAYIMSLSGITGRMDIIDYDKIEISNCSSSLLFTAEEAFHSLRKVDSCKQRLSKSNIQVRSYKFDYNEYLQDKEISRIEPDVILCLANERNIWNTIQTKYPPLVLHATTTSSWGINLGRHVPLLDWCLMCRFEKKIRGTFKPVCGTGEIKIGNTNEIILGNLPFLSPAAAVLIFAELIRVHQTSLLKTNFTQYSFKPAGGGTFISGFLPPRKDCNGCKGQKSDIYTQLRGKSKYWDLSRF